MIRVCDAIMGTGKSSAAITYMNEHPNERFIYITPFLREANRIARECAALRFVEPGSGDEDGEESKGGKVKHTALLIKQNRNIATTHQSFKRYTPEMLDDIRTRGYTLLIDENMDTLEEYSIHPCDMRLLLESGYLVKDGDACHTTDKEYTGEVFRKMFQNLESRDLIVAGDEDDDNKIVQIYCWVLPPELLKAFKDVIIMTYLFEGQGLYQMLKMNHMEYEYIGVDVSGSGKNKQYRFSADTRYVPEYVRDIRNKIHILDNSKLNAIGKDKTALSMAWFGKNESNANKLKNNISNCFKHIWGDAPLEEKMWSTYKGCEEKLEGKGYTKSYLVFNERATNKYKNKTKLVYAVNLYSNVAKRQFFGKHGVDLNDDMYALSTMVQWIWRSAIRDGREIEIYLPSRRMRELLINWMDKISKEAE